MSNLSVRKVVSFVVLLSLILQSCGSVSLSIANPVFSIPGKNNAPKVEPSNYQPPEFERPQPRTSDRRESWQGSSAMDSSSKFISTPVKGATPIVTTPGAPIDSPENLNSNGGEELSTDNIVLDGDTWILNGNADSTSIFGAVKLTDDATMLRGSAWASQQIDLSQDFDRTFMLNVGDNGSAGADGIAFVFQSVGTGALGNLGGALGYGSITPSVAVEFDTYYNFEYNDPTPNSLSGNEDHVSLLKNGIITHDGSLPTILRYAGFEDGTDFPVHITWNATTKTLTVEGWFSHTEDFVQTVFGGSPYVWFGFTAATAASKNLQYFYPGSTIVTDRTTNSSDLGDNSNLSCVAICTQGYEGGPINTRTGGYDYSVTDISIQTDAGPLTFERSYSSKVASFNTGGMGYGWTHNHDLKLLISPYDTNGKRELTLKGHTANQYLFTQQSGSNITTPEPGVYGTLVQGPSSFVLTDRAQNQYDFNLTTGRIISFTDPNGHKLLYTFDTKGRLSKISDQSNTRYLTFAYSGNGTNIISVTDHTARKITYGYNNSGDLTSAKDVLAKTWTYTYDTFHRMTRVTDPAA